MVEPRSDPNLGPESRGGFWRRVNLSTWFFLSVAAGAIFFVQFPGRRTSFTAYAHGWPFAYLDRDYSDDSRLFAPDGSVAGVQVESFGPVDTSLDIDEPTAPATKAEVRRSLAQEWAINGFPWSLESKMSPWSFDNAGNLNLLAGAIDLALSVGLLVLLGRAYQRWLAARLGPFTLALGMLLLGIAAGGSAFNRVAAWRQDQADEQAAIARLSDDIGFMRWQYASDPFGGIPPRPRGAKVEVEGWNPPGWLPESILKIGSFAELFRRVSYVQLVDSEKINDATLEPMTAFHELRRLEIAWTKITESGLAKLSAFPRLADLLIDRPTITDSGAAHLAKCRGLKRLNLFGTEITDAGLDRLADLSALADLSLGSSKITADGVKSLAKIPSLSNLSLTDAKLSDAAVEPINRLGSLERLTLSNSGIVHLALHDLSQLGDLDFRGENGTLDLKDLPALNLLAFRDRAKSRVKHAQARLAGVPKLRIVVLEGTFVDDGIWRQISDLPRLEGLVLYNVDFWGATSPQIVWPGKLREIGIDNTDLTELSIANLPRLQRLEVCANSELAKASFRKLPALEAIVLNYDGKLANLEFEGAENLRELKTDMGAPRARFGGLAGLKNLRSFASARTPVHAATVADLGEIPNLQSLELSSAELTDEELGKLRRLTGIRNLEISSNDLSDKGLNYLTGLTQLSEMNLCANRLTIGAVDKLRSTLPAATITFQEFAWQTANPAPASPDSSPDRSIRK